MGRDRLSLTIEGSRARIDYLAGHLCAKKGARWSRHRAPIACELLV